MAEEKYIYKIVTVDQWKEAEASGIFKGAPIDLADGYIHFSTNGQMRETAQKHFHGQQNLLLVEVEAAPLGEALQWEASRGGALFPHLYAELEVIAATRILPLVTKIDGSHIFPEEL